MSLAKFNLIQNSVPLSKVADYVCVLEFHKYWK
jgi:hypothetical protein